jgi:hypothetical protein
MFNRPVARAPMKVPAMSTNESRTGDFKLDVVDADEPRAAASGRPYLQIYFKCANSYQRVYRDRAGRGYCARCPKCGKTMNFVVGEGGSPKRFFELSC